jgi:hypothetical protein
MRIENRDTKFQSGEKRCHLPIVATETCSCGHVMRQDLEDDYLSYPDFNEPMPLTFYCGDCGVETRRQVIIRVRMEEVPAEVQAAVG